MRPKAILSDRTQGDIQNPDGLITGAATTVFTGAHDSFGTPELVVDFGQNVVGQLLLEFAGSTNGSSSEGFPGIRLTFSEALEYLTNVSDYTRSDRAQGVRLGYGMFSSVQTSIILEIVVESEVLIYVYDRIRLSWLPRGQIR